MSWMLRRIVKSVAGPLDWLWPLPLGIIFGALVFSVLAGTWMAVRGPAPRLEPRVRRNPRSDPNAAAVPNAPTSRSASTAPEQAGPPFVADNPPVHSKPVNPTAANTPSQSERARQTTAPETRMSNPRTPPVREATSTAQTALVQPQAEKTPAASESKVAGIVSRLSPVQEAELKEKLTLGRFFMDRKDYRAALGEFQAALAIDPSSREAQVAMRQARDASNDAESPPNHR